MGPLGVDLLFRVGQLLEAGTLQADDPRVAAFNEALLCCLPKAASYVNAEGLDCFLAEETRPLSIGNTVNRLLASAYRLRWEPLLAPAISPCQRGVLTREIHITQRSRDGA